MTAKSTIVKHPIVSLMVGGFTIYAGYWAVQQLHWLVSHAFTVLLFAALVSGVLVVARKVSHKADRLADPEPTAEEMVRGWAPPVQALPQAHAMDSVNDAYLRLVKQARSQ